MDPLRDHSAACATAAKLAGRWTCIDIAASDSAADQPQEFLEDSVRIHGRDLVRLDLSSDIETAVTSPDRRDTAASMWARPPAASVLTQRAVFDCGPDRVRDRRWLCSPPRAGRRADGCVSRAPLRRFFGGAVAILTMQQFAASSGREQLD